MSDCIPWWGQILPSGYGIMNQYRRRTRAHRFIWEECFGDLPEGSIVHHKCRNKLCVNPEHLEALTRAEHNSVHQAEVTRCPRGHPYDEPNTYWRKKNGVPYARKCRACNRDRERGMRA